MSHVVKTDFRKSCPFQYPVEHMEYAVRRDGTACGRGKHIFAVGFAPLLFENLHGVLPDGNASIGVLRLERGSENPLNRGQKHRVEAG